MKLDSGELSPNQQRIDAFVEVGAAKLAMDRSAYWGLIHPRAGFSQPVLNEAAADIGREIYGLLLPNALDTNGISPEEIRALHLMYATLDRQVTLGLLHGPRITDVTPLQHVVARLGKKATREALRAFNRPPCATNYHAEKQGLQEPYIACA